MKIKILKVEKKPWYIVWMGIDRFWVTFKTPDGETRRMSVWGGHPIDTISSLLYSLFKKIQKEEEVEMNEDLKLTEGKEVDSEESFHLQAEELKEKYERKTKLD